MGGCVTTPNKNQKIIPAIPMPEPDPIIVQTRGLSPSHSIPHSSTVGTSALPTPIMINPTPTPPITHIPVYSRLLPDENAMSFNNLPQASSIVFDQKRVLQPVTHPSNQNLLSAPIANQLPSIIQKIPQISSQIPNLNSDLSQQQITLTNIHKQIINKPPVIPPIVHQNQRPVSPYQRPVSPFQRPISPYHNQIVQRSFQNHEQLPISSNDLVKPIKPFIPITSVPSYPNQNNGFVDFDRNMLNMNQNQINHNNASPQLYTFSYGLKMPIMGQQYQRARAF